jgi:glycosyltransferase involved in cell wall biosynthesis
MLDLVGHGASIAAWRHGEHQGAEARPCDVPRRGVSPLRVAFYAETNAVTGVGGSEKFLVDLIAHLDPTFRVVVAGNPDPAFDDFLEQRLPSLLPRPTVGVATHDRSITVRAFRRLRPNAPASLRSARAPAGDTAGEDGAQPTWHLMSVAAVRYQQAVANFGLLLGLFRRLRPDVLHVNNGGYPGAHSCRVAVLAARAAGVPRIVHFVHNIPEPPRWPARMETLFDSAVERATDVWVTGAQQAADELCELYGIPTARVRVVYLGQPVGSVATKGSDSLGDIPAGRPVVTAIGLLEDRKGHSVLLEALRRLADEPPAVHAVVVGDGPLREALEEHAEGLGLGSTDVQFLGWRDDVSAVLRATDVLVHPSLGKELLPYAIKEAMAHELPVVATRVGGIPELVSDGVTGMLVRPGDDVALAGAIAQLVRNPGRARRMGQEGKRRIEEDFSVASMVEAMQSLYRESC